MYSSSLTGLHLAWLLAHLFDAASNFSNPKRLVDGEPRTLPLKRALQIFIEHRQVVIVRRTNFDLAKARARQHILDGYLIALANLDAVIKTIRESEDADVAKQNLVKRFKLSDLQAQAILDMQLRRLAALERQQNLIQARQDLWLTIARYARGIDEQREEELAAILTDDVVFQTQPWSQGPLVGKALALKALRNYRQAFRCPRHFITNHQLLLNDFTGMVHTVLANMSFLPRNQDFYLIPAAAAKRTM